MKIGILAGVLMLAIFFGLTAGALAQQNTQENSIRIGVSMGLSGAVSNLSEQYLKGAQLLIKDINEQGGISQNQIELIVLDDGYDAQRSAQNTMQLINNENVIALFSYVGTATTAFCLPIIKANNMILLGVLSGAQVFHSNPNIFNIRASYQQEIEGFVKHCLQDLKLKKIAVLYQYDAFGMDGLKSAELLLFQYSGYKIEPVATAMYKRESEDVEEAFLKIKDSGAEAVILVGVAAPVVEFANKCAKSNFKPLLYTLSVAEVESLKKGLAENAGSIIVSHVVPSLQMDSLVVKEYKQLLNKYFPNDNPTMLGLEGFINARILVAALRKCEGVFNKESVRRALENIKNLDVGEIIVNFGPDDHQAMDNVYYSEVSNGQVNFLDNWKTANK